MIYSHTYPHFSGRKHPACHGRGSSGEATVYQEYSYDILRVYLCCTFGTRVLHFSGTVFSICLHLIHILIFFVIRLLLFVNTVITYIPFCLLARFIRPLSFCSYNIRPVKSIIVTCFTSFAKDKTFS